MSRKVLLSFHHKLDYWRAFQVRSSGVVDCNAPVSDKEWEIITKGGENAIKRWISEQLAERTCVVVLIGPATAGRMWINHEVRQAWNEGKGVVGIYVHNLKNRTGNQSAKGANPFDRITISGGFDRLSSLVKTYDPPYITSEEVHTYIKTYMDEWIEEAISIRHAALHQTRCQPAIRNA
ncbi:MAG: TIR domain-containing protein [Steroidobacteraceae bacterium]